jgi:hypothetical protein
MFSRAKISLFVVLSIFANTALPQNLVAAKTIEVKTANHSKMISDVFNKFRYDMTVEWDQKDPYFKEYAQTQFENSLADLTAQGVSAEEIQAYTESNLLDEKTKKDYRNLLATMKAQGLSSEKASAAASKFMEKNYARGVNFSAGASVNYKKIIAIVGVIIVGVVTYLIVKHCKKPEDNSSATSEATTTSVTSSETSQESEAASQESETSSQESSSTYSEQESSSYSSEVTSQESSSTYGDQEGSYSSSYDAGSYSSSYESSSSYGDQGSYTSSYESSSTCDDNYNPYDKL